MTLDQIARMLRPLSTRIANLVGRGVVSSADDAKKTQELQVDLLEGETRDELERFQEYGFTSRPRPGAECLVVFVGGRREHGYCIGTEDKRYRIKNLESGEVAVYNDTGAKIVLMANGDIEVTPKSGQKLKVSADVEVTGTLTASADVVGGGISLKNHTHPADLTTASNCTAGGSTGTATGDTGVPS